MGCQANKAALPEGAREPPGRTLLAGARQARAGAKGDAARGSGLEPRGEAAVPRASDGQRESPLEPLPEDGKSDWHKEALAAGTDQIQRSPTRGRKPSLAPSTGSAVGSSSTSPGLRSNSAMSISTTITPVSRESCQSQRTRTSGASGQLQEANPEATPRLETELPAATPRVESPAGLWVVAPGRPALQGEYGRVLGVIANGEAIWRQLAGDGILFSCTAGFWMIADDRDKIERNLGQLRTVDRHLAKLPHECTRWMYGDDSRSWAVDAEGTTLVTANRELAEQRMQQNAQRAALRVAQASRRAARAPDKLWVAAPPRPALQGEYAKVQGHLENDAAVWKQVHGQGLLLDSGGRWALFTDELDVASGRAQIRTAAPHSGKPPHQLAIWKYVNSDGRWTSDYVRAIRVVVDSSLVAHIQANYACDEAAPQRTTM
mmetsp:Transcript_86967/g.246576  ORF Transcript_86967/g.246576 Transcript_86967/m.246576 type:complete len:433 (-) Transcript_86967:557-1855(-)